ncbi:MAG: enoyl-CoA hydratase/isomerase family protein [Acidimicrobiia bacterium]|nr:enoyl-CoA hydratase/isomerase family protein [Acidimicrobiia bacterium]MYE71924.1 enoyl-CoA hydratase/isomerase family protein [Acidimicrobiia bacterium]MYJ63095.1 enoyl-CoA hydratase/isomerase family protein [Acidimicrobiia bacterium]
MKPYPTPPEGLLVVTAPPILTLTLDRPQRRNALTDDIVLALIDTLEAASADEEIRTVLLNATGDNFCSGFDLAGRTGDGTRPRPGSISRRMPYLVNRLIPVMLEVQVPIVCAVRGWAVGLGLSLVLASDFAVAADDARLRAPFTAMGITPDSGTSWLLPRLAGVARAKGMLMLGEEVSGAEAAEWGLIHRAVPPDRVDAEVAVLADRLASSATVAVGLTKTLVQRGRERSLETHMSEEAFAMELSSRSADFQEWAASREEGRPPDFTGH